MSIVLTHRYLVRDVHAIPFLTKHGIGFHYFSRNSVLHVHQKLVPVSALKRFRYPQKASFKPSKPSSTKKSQPQQNPVHEKPIQAPAVPRQTQERERFYGSVTMGAAPSLRHVPIPITFALQKGSRNLQN